MLLVFAFSFLLVSPAAGLAITAPILELAGLSHLEAGVMGVMITVLFAVLLCLYAFLKTFNKVLNKISPDLTESEQKARNIADREKLRASAKKFGDSLKMIKEEYVALPPNEKERINQLGTDLARLACKAGAEHLAKKGRPNASAAVDRLSRF